MKKLPQPAVTASMPAEKFRQREEAMFVRGLQCGWVSAAVLFILVEFISR